MYTAMHVDVHPVSYWIIGFPDEKRAVCLDLGMVLEIGVLVLIFL